MITVIASFPLPEGLSLGDFKGRMMPTVPKYREVDGLLRKNYLYDGERGVGGGVYTFETRAQAETCFNDEWITRVTTHYGKPEISYFETPIAIDNAHKEVNE